MPLRKSCIYMIETLSVIVNDHIELNVHTACSPSFQKEAEYRTLSKDNQGDE